MNAVLFGASDKQIEELLLACQVRVKTLPYEDLMALGIGSAAPPDIVVLDLRQRPAIPSTLQAIRRAHPHVGVLIVVSALDPALMLEAMRAGVNEVVPEPLTQQDLRAAIARLAVSIIAPATGQVFAFVGAKGGIGTTTVAVNVAADLAKLEKGSVLLIDLHIPYGDAAVYLGVEARFTVADALENTHRVDPALLRSLVVHAGCGADLLAAPDRTLGVTVDPRRLSALIECAAVSYRYVVLDVPRSDVVILDSLGSAASIFVVLNQELATVRNAGRLTSSLRHRYGPDRIRTILNRFDSVAEITQQDVDRALGKPADLVLPSHYRLALGALTTGRPLVLENHNKLSAAFTAFTGKLAGVKAKPAAKRSGSILGLGSWGRSASREK
jgi:pilus assembly protein CpaE